MKIFTTPTSHHLFQFPFEIIVKMKQNKINTKSLIIFIISALVFSIVIAEINDLKTITHDLASVLFAGLLSCVIFFSGCILMHKKVAGLSYRQGMTGSLISIPIFIIFYLLISAFYDINYLYGPEYDTVLWIYSLLLYFISNIICMFVMKMITERRKKWK